MRIRRASARDIEAIATLHAESWRQNYRGVYADAYLDGDVVDDRRSVWRERLSVPSPHAVTLIADVDGTVAGFAHTVLESDPVWGALLDNLHVAARFKRRGLGRLLMAASADAVVRAAPASGLYLWVLEQNGAARAFYRALGGELEDSEETEAPGGGTVTGLRIVWRDPSVLLRERNGEPPRLRG